MCGVLRLHVWRASSVFARVRFQCPCGTPVPVWDSTNFRRAFVSMGLYYKTGLTIQCTCGVPRLHVWRASSVFAHVRFQCPCGTPVPLWDSTNFRRAFVSMGLYYKTGLTIQCTCGVPRLHVW